MTNIAAGVEGSNPLLNIIIFAAFVLITLVIVFRASRNTKTA
jgi:cation/acetate symporter